MWTDIVPGRKPRPGEGAGWPRDLVTPHSNQHIAPGGQAGEDHARLPRLAQDHVQAERAPDGEQAEHRAAADVDDVLRQQGLAQRDRARAQPEQRDVHRLAVAGAEGRVELADLRLAVARGGRQQADLGHRRRRLGEAQDEVVEGGVLRLHREAAPAHGKDRRFRPRQA